MYLIRQRSNGGECGGKDFIGVRACHHKSVEEGSGRGGSEATSSSDSASKRLSLSEGAGRAGASGLRAVESLFIQSRCSPSCWAHFGRALDDAAAPFDHRASRRSASLAARSQGRFFKVRKGNAPGPSPRARGALPSRGRGAKDSPSTNRRTRG